jgi:hypothetical protein
MINPKLPAIQEARPPLSQSLRLARPSEEGERGTGRWWATLKVRGEERKREGK